MTLVADPVSPPTPEPVDPDREPTRPAESPAPGSGTRTVRVSMVVLAAAASCGGSAWMVGGLFRPALLARALGLVGVLIGAGVVLLSYRLARPATAQYFVLPVAALAGAIIVAPDATGGTANLPGLIGEALTSGGLSQPPTPFDPGWRFLIVVLLAATTAAAAINAVRLTRPRLAVVVPTAVTLAGAVLQPKGSELLSSAVGVVFIVAGLALSFGAELAEDTELGARFEMRRLARGAGLGLALVAVLGLLSQVGFLFPDTENSEVQPPRRPPAPQPEKDRELFRVDIDRPGPWRVGVLDVYDGTSWLLPPYDTTRLLDIEGGVLPGTDPAGRETFKVRFTLLDVRGHTLPIPAGAVGIDGAKGAELDPRTGAVRLPARIPQDLTYTVEALAPPRGLDLNTSPAPAEDFARAFTQAPSPPTEVVALLEEAPTSPFDRLQFLRDRLFSTVVAAGQGNLVDVTPERVVQMLQAGAEATPFEITAAEALLARWAGVPSRIGFGFNQGDTIENGVRSFRPKHGAAWLEAYFEGSGWVPLVGVPPRAKSSTTDTEKNLDPRVRPTEVLALEVFLPTERRTLHQIYVIVRYWVLATLPFILGAVALVLLFPVLMKQIRARRRAHWAADHGPLGRIIVAYAAFRDACHDLNLGDVRLTPVEFADAFSPDDEHEELAYLVTRAAWGDLRRDLRDEDAEVGEELARSVLKRVRLEQPAGNRLVGALSRTSLRDPWSDQLPNAWFGRRASRGRRRSPVAVVRGAVRGLFRRPAAAAVFLVMAFAGAALPSCGGGASGASAAPRAIPDLLTPESVIGFTAAREPKAEEKYAEAADDVLVDAGVVHVFRRANSVEASLQVARFRDGVDNQDRKLQRDIESSIGGTFRTYWFGSIRMRIAETQQQRVFLWFPPDHNVMEVLVVRASVAEALQLARAVAAYQLGVDPAAAAGTVLVTTPPPPRQLDEQGFPVEATLPPEETAP